MFDLPNIISVIGWLAISVVLLKSIHIISIYVLPSRLGRYAHPSPNGEQPWALVTGASDGIGREFAHELATRGFNVVLHGRNHEKLSRVLAQMQQGHPDRSFRILVANAANVPCMNCMHSNQQRAKPHESDGAGDKRSSSEGSTAVDFGAIRESLGDLHLTVLINNAGGGPANPTFLPVTDSPAARITGNVSLNALFPFHLIRELLPILEKNEPSLILNISSFSDQGYPLLASYSASKAFLMNLTRTLRLELALDDKRSGVEVLGVRVARVTGVSHNNVEASMFTPDSRTMASAALDRVGWGHGLVIGHWAHALQGIGVGMIPAWMEEWIISALLREERAQERAGQ